MSFKYRGRVTAGCQYHDPAMLEQGRIIAPQILESPTEGWPLVPKYGETVIGESVEYDPAGNCDGTFMSYKNQPNNNCYAYGANIATNTFPQPGRASVGSTPWSVEMTAKSVTANAVLDGLVELQQKTIFELLVSSGYVQGSSGHFVALVISEPETGFEGDPTAMWGGDYHWVRADHVDMVNKTISWSQKDGGDQVTNFDFAGKPITDPATACWEVNLGKVKSFDSKRPDDVNDLIVDYKFHTYMWVPSTGVKIL